MMLAYLDPGSGSALLGTIFAVPFYDRFTLSS